MSTNETDAQAGFHNRPEVLKHYFLLENLGVFEYIEQLKLNIRELENLLQDASGIFSQKQIDSLIEFISQCIGSKFVPTTLTFLLKDRLKGVRGFSYRNLRPATCAIELDSLDSLEEFFLQFPNTIQFELFEYQFPDHRVIEELSKDRPEIVVPLLGIAGLYGVILFGPKLMDTQYSDTEINYIGKLMRFTEISIQNNINYQNAVTDLKTGLYNHSFFMKRLAEEWSNSLRYNSPLGMLVIDIDHFKQFNDTKGHLAGDEAIIAIGNAIRRNVREGDVVARFGGEEFTVLFLHSGRLQTWNSAERIRKAVEATRIRFKEHEYSVTVSIGATTIKARETDILDDFILNADKALYEAKRMGRNRTIMNGPSLLFSALSRLHSSRFPAS